MKFRRRTPEPAAPPEAPTSKATERPDLAPQERRDWETPLSRAGRPSLQMVPGGSPAAGEAEDRHRADLHVVPQRGDSPSR